MADTGSTKKPPSTSGRRTPGSAGAEERTAAAEPVGSLGTRLKRVRQQSGLSLREVARQLGVSPSFVSQLENGKSQPSVATLYSISQLLDVSIDELFSGEVAEGDLAEAVPDAPRAVAGDSRAVAAPEAPGPVNRAVLGSPADAWPRNRERARISVTRPGERSRLEMESGVVWEQLATNTGMELDFMEIVYPPHSTSTSDQRMLQHTGHEFGYLLEGQLEITVGFEVFTLHPGEAVGFDSSTPHLLANVTDVPARGIWFVQHPHG